MPINNDSLNKNLYNLLKTQGFDPQPKDSTGKSTPVPDEADVFKFTFKSNNVNEDGEQIKHPAWATIENGQLKVYYDDTNMDQGSAFTNFLKQLKRWSQRRQLGFDTENEDHLANDMAQREHMKKKENIAEGYYPMGKSASYNDSVPTVKIVLQHTRQIQEGEQRYRNVARIYLENVQGERILAPTNRPGIAQVYARHLAEGGVPNDERWNHIKSLCEEYSKMAGFVRAVRGNQFNESAQRLVEAGLNHYQSLRESLGKMRGHRGYTAYFESWTPTLMETEGDETNLNELFVQETLDPRIESVMPILNRLKVDLSEMKEVNELAEWADSVLESEEVEEALDPKELARMKIQKPAFQRTRPGQKLDLKDLRTAGQMSEPAPKDPAHGLNISGKEGLAALTKRLKDIGQLEEEEVEESGLQAYLGNKKYGKEGMDALRKAGREHASKEKMANIRAKYDKLDEDGVIEGTITAKDLISGVDDNYYPMPARNEYNLKGVTSISTALNQQRDKVDEPFLAAIEKLGGTYTVDDRYPYGTYYYIKVSKPESFSTFLDLMNKKYPTTPIDVKGGVAENLDANQKRVGQLGPTEPVGKNEKNLRGKLVGASESFINTSPQAVVTEMDKSQPSSDRGGESSGDPNAKGSKATPVKAKDAAKDAKKVLDKSMDKAHKKDVKEGQDDLEALLRLIK